MKNIKIINITDSPLAISALDGDEVFNKIKKQFDLEKEVVLDFEDIKLTITAFLNSAIGNLYAIYDVQKIRKFLKIINMTQEDLQLLKIVIEEAKLRFSKIESDQSNNFEDE